MGHNVAPATVNKGVVSSWVGVGGGWKRVLGRWVGVGGVWKKFFVAGTVRLAPATVRGFAYDPDVPSARIDFTANGDATGTYTDQTIVEIADIGNWYDPLSSGVGSAFQIRANKVSGEATVTGSALGSWLTLSSTRGWQISGGGAFNAGKSASIMVDIRLTGGTEIIASTIYLLSVVTYQEDYPSGIEGREGGVDLPVKYRWDL